MSDGPAYRRVLLKLSGEALMGPLDSGVHTATLDELARQVAEVCALGTRVGVVVGGGNFWRGLSGVGRKFDRARSDTIGMLATVMNCLVFRDALERCGVECSVMTALEMPRVAETFVRERAQSYFELGKVVLLGAGTGHPYFSTDTAAALRALEIGAEALLKATKVDGVYSNDPTEDPGAVRYERISYKEVLERGLRFMDATAVALCMENRLPVHVFSCRVPGNLLAVVRGDPVGTVVS